MPICAGVTLKELERLVTTADPSGKVLMDICPTGMTESQICHTFGGSSDITVDAYLYSIGDVNSMSVIDKGKTVHIPPDERKGVIREHRRDVLDTATLHNPFPYLQCHFPVPVRVFDFSCTIL